MNDERVEAAAKWKAVAMYDGPQHDPKYWAVVDGDGRKVLDTLNADSRWTTDEQEQMAKRCVAALAAADAASGERVMWTNQTGEHVSVTIPQIGGQFWVFIGESIVVSPAKNSSCGK